MRRIVNGFALLAAACPLLFIALTSAASADNQYQWSVASGSWSAPANWGGTVPTGYDDACINNGGTVTIASAVATCNNLFVGGGGAGAVEMTGGSLAAFYPGVTPFFIIYPYPWRYDFEYVGMSAVGTFTQSGGMNTCDLIVGYGIRATGSYTLAGSGRVSAGEEFLGYWGTGNFTQSGGTNNTMSLCFGYQAGGGTYNLNGGLLTASQISAGYGIGTFNLNGGTLQVLSSCTTFFQGLTNVYVQAGGAKIDSHGQNVTLAEPLLHDPALGAMPDGGLTKYGGGTLTLTGSNAYTGGTTIVDGAIQYGDGATVNGSIAGNVTDNGILTIANPAAQTVSITIRGSGSLTKLGSGTLTLTGTNTYTGPTNLSGGTLVNNGAIAGPTNVNSGGMAKGSGRYGPLTLNSGGTFSPGNSPGSVTTGTTSWNGGGEYLFELNNATGTAGANWDLWHVIGTLSIAATSSPGNQLTLAVVSDNGTLPGLAADFDPTQNDSWLIADASGGILGFDPAAFQINTSGFSNSLGGGHFAVAQSGNSVYLDFVSAVPEPGTFALLGAGAIGLAAYAWRRRGHAAGAVAVSRCFSGGADRRLLGDRAGAEQLL